MSRPEPGNAAGDAADSPRSAAGPERATHGLFFAVYPDEATAARLVAFALELRAALGLKGRAFPAARLHVTLHHLGNHAGLPPALVEAARRAAAQVRMPPCGVAFDRVASFDRKARNRPLVLLGAARRDGAGSAGDPGSRSTAGHGAASDSGMAHGLPEAGVEGLQHALGAALRAVGLGRWVERHPTPHLTLLYDDRAVPPRPIEPVAWSSHEFVLMQSLLGRSRHLPIERWPLRG